MKPCTSVNSSAMQLHACHTHELRWLWQGLPLVCPAALSVVPREARDAGHMARGSAWQAMQCTALPPPMDLVVHMLRSAPCPLPPALSPYSCVQYECEDVEGDGNLLDALGVGLGRAEVGWRA